jgi:hypothetical protein
VVAALAAAAEAKMTGVVKVSFREGRVRYWTKEQTHRPKGEPA